MPSPNAPRIRIHDRYTAKDVDAVLTAVHDCLRAGDDELVFDFSDVASAWADAIVPIIITADWLRSRSIAVSIEMPRDPEFSRLFINTSWAHSLDPRFPPSDVNIDHFNAKRFASPDEQHGVVNEIMRLAIAKLHPSKDVRDLLEWSINEITDNVLIHSQAGQGIVHVTSTENAIILCVGDAGRGILNSLREGHPELRDEAHALREAIKKGVTRNPAVGQGNGLTGTLRIATMSGGNMRIASHLGRLDATRSDVRTQLRSKRCELMGTVVTGFIRTNSDLTMADALEFTGVRAEHVGILDFYGREEGSMVIKLSDEAKGVGSRAAGEYLRIKCEHLLSGNPEKALVFDWVGTSLKSSSFADELLAKLFIALGPLAFGARVRHRNMDGVTAQLIEKAILQRVAQLGSQPSTQSKPV